MGGMILCSCLVCYGAFLCFNSLVDISLIYAANFEKKKLSADDFIREILLDILLFLSHLRC